MRNDRSSAPPRARIIEAHLRLLAENSRRKVTASAVARTAQCNRDTFYYHFSSLDDAARAALDELVPHALPGMIRAFVEEDASLKISERARARMKLVAKIVRAHPAMRRHLEAALKEIWIAELGIDAADPTAEDDAVLGFMAAGVVGFATEHLAEARDDTDFDASLYTIARTFGKSALGYARERGLLR